MLSYTHVKQNQWLLQAINRSKFFANRKKILEVSSQTHSSLAQVKLNPYWVTGFTDADGCFYINKGLTKKGTQSISSTYKVAQDYKDLNILYDLQNYFSCGNITIHKSEVRFEIMGSEKALKYVIPHFDKYPQITQKNADYLLWKEIIVIQNKKQHLALDGLQKCLSLKASLNKGFNPTFKTLFPNIIPNPRALGPFAQAIINPYWLSGFTAGDGSFFIVISKNRFGGSSLRSPGPTNCKTGYQVSAGWNIGQHIKDIDQLYKIKDYQCCGIVYKEKLLGRVVVKKLVDIQNFIIPHYAKYPLCNNKQDSFITWCEIIKKIENKEHQTEKGLNEIRILRENMR